VAVERHRVLSGCDQSSGSTGFQFEKSEVADHFQPLRDASRLMTAKLSSSVSPHQTFIRPDTSRMK
jgi:hypothetical protein